MATGQLDPVLNYLRRVSAAAGGPTDGELLERYRCDGDRAAFAVLVERHGTMVFGVCRRVLGNAHDAEDALQMVFLHLVRKVHSISKRESVGSWLHGVAYRTALKARTAAGRRRALERHVATSAAVDSVPELIWRELRPVLDEEIARLPERYRLPFICCYLEGKTHAEAARLLSWPKGTVATQLSRAREQLRRRLERRGVFLSAGLLVMTLARHTRAALPPGLKAVVFAAVRSGAVGPATGTFAKGVLMLLSMTKLRTVTAALLALGVLGAGMGLIRHQEVVGPQPDRDTAPPVAAASKDGQAAEARVAAVADAQTRLKQFELDCLVTETTEDGTENRLISPKLICLEKQTSYVQIATAGTKYPTARDGSRVLPHPMPAASVPIPVVGRLPTAASAAAPTDPSTGPETRQEGEEGEIGRLDTPEFPVGLSIRVKVLSRPGGWLLLDVTFMNTVLEEDAEDAWTAQPSPERRLQSGISTEKDKATGVRTGVVRGHALHALRRIKPGDTLKLELNPTEDGKRRLHIAITPRELDAIAPRSNE